MVLVFGFCIAVAIFYIFLIIVFRSEKFGFIVVGFNSLDVIRAGVI